MIALEKRPTTAPIFFARCPAHAQLVALDGEGHLLGKCGGCILEAARALLTFRGRS